MKIEPHDRDTYLVTSSTDPSLTYSVDIDSKEFPDGTCTCPWFLMKIAPGIESGRKGETTCKHIRAVKEWKEKQ